MADELERLNRALGGHYRVHRKLGQGGTASVYLADDLKHHRSVAVKVLRPELASALGPERFIREIRLTARLDHPHILPLLDSGESDQLLYYVMPYVEGETLRDRLNREKQLPVEDALRIARDVADALDYAHRLGVVHRDIKPENILLSAGHARVADFGIARALDSAGGEKLTATGMIVATPLYMSPEQATGSGAVDGRSDLYSLGCVLYETLAGQPPFTGPTAESMVHQHLAARPPDVTSVRPAVPAALAAAVQRVLAKTPADRYATAAEFAEALEGGVSVSGQPLPARSPARPWWKGAARSPAFWVLGLTVVVGLVLWRGRAGPSGPGLPPAAFVVPLPAGDTLDAGLAVTISPDGSRFVYAARRDGGTRLYSRPIDEIASVPIPGTEGATHPFFSPDGRSIAFVLDGFLRRIPASGGQSTAVVRLDGGFAGASWGEDDTILFARTGARPGIFRVAATGGVPEPVAQPGEGESSYWWPSQVSERTILFAVLTGMALDATRIELLRTDTGERRVLLEEGNHPRYVASGHIVYAGRFSVSGNVPLRAVSFDRRRSTLRGPPVTIRDSVGFAPGSRAGQFDVSREGSFVYVQPRPTEEGSTLFWVDRAGNAEALDFLPSRLYGVSLMFAPDGRRLGVTSVGDSLKTWLVDLERRMVTAFSPGDHNNHLTVWSPSGDRIVFASDREDGVHNLYWKSPDGTGPAERLTRSPQHQDPGSWSPDGRYLTFAEEHPDTGWDLWLLDLGSSPAIPTPLVRTGSDEFSPMISPDGRWLAYVSGESGRLEVYVARFPDLSGRQQVSREGGRDPLWSPDGTELFYISGPFDTTCPDADGTEVCVWAVPFRPGTELSPGSPRVLFVGGTDSFLGFGWPSYDVTPDGRRFVVVRRGDLAPGRTEFVVTLNWFTELRNLASTH
jgi:eukaryotic-like serine/threonine-protein kinase